MVIVHPRELDKAAVRSLLADAIAAPAATPASPEDKKANEQLAAALEAARKKHPDDLSVAIAEALLALAPAMRSGSSRRSTGLTGWSRRHRWTLFPRASRPTRASGPRRPARSRSGWSPGRAGSGKMPPDFQQVRRQAGRASPGRRRPSDREPDPDGHAPRTGPDGSRARRPPRRPRPPGAGCSRSSSSRPLAQSRSPARNQDRRPAPCQNPPQAQHRARLVL